VIAKLVLGELLRRHSRRFLKEHSSSDPQKKQLDSILGRHTPSHFLAPHLLNENAKPRVEPDISNLKLDSIDRFTMVKSRIV
jgi:hypothetical protein